MCAPAAMRASNAISADALRIIAPEKLKADDFRQIGPQIDSLIEQHGKIRLLIDASGFKGWENIAAFESHAGFIKNHHRRIEHVAVIGTCYRCGQNVPASGGEGLQ
jgi:hypothetical protein